jgi:hypothetical protein
LQVRSIVACTARALLFHSPQAAPDSICADQPQASPILALARSCFKYPFTSSTCTTSLPLTPSAQLTVIQKDFTKYPRVAAWLADMRALPEYDAAHSILQVFDCHGKPFLFLINAHISRPHASCISEFTLLASYLLRAAGGKEERGAQRACCIKTLNVG